LSYIWKGNVPPAMRRYQEEKDGYPMEHGRGCVMIVSGMMVIKGNFNIPLLYISIMTVIFRFVGSV
jgi:hypothetical protein